MKKIISVFALFIFVLAKSPVLADEIVDASGAVIPCKVETVADGLIEYTSEGNLYCFHREKSSQIFNDYVDVRVNLRKKEAITRYSGQLISKDSNGAIIRNDSGDMHIPWYRVKFVGIYKP